MLSERTIWYNLTITDGLGPVALQKILLRLNALHSGVSALMGKSDEWLSNELGIPMAVATRLEDQLQSPLEPPQCIEPIQMMLPGDDDFPIDRMALANPPLSAPLWAIGDIALLSANVATIGVAGSRETTEEIVELTRDLTSSASRAGICVVSGLAQGVDTAAHEGALVGRSGTIGVMASGINKHKGYVPADGLDSICFVSQFSPDDPWSGPRAMQRNSTIAALSDRIVVMAAGKSGGSWEMAQLCLKRKKPLFVLDVETDVAEGNQALIRAGAIPFSGSNLEVCWRVEVESEPQLSLFD